MYRTDGRVFISMYLLGVDIDAYRFQASCIWIEIPLFLKRFSIFIAAIGWRNLRASRVRAFVIVFDW